MDFKSIVKFEIGISKRKLSVLVKGYFKRAGRKEKWGLQPRSPEPQSRIQKFRAMA